MKFTELNVELGALRNELRTFVSDDALGEISVQPPAGDDEASFLRLIAWSYVLIFETGRVTIPYLLKLPTGICHTKLRPDSACDLVHDLRTWSFHNLGYTDEHSVRISKRVTRWFIDACGANPPRDRDGWRRCFERLCTEVGAILAYCRDGVELVLAGSEDGNDIACDLRRRLDRNWPAYRFDMLVSDAATRIGQTIDAPKFRQSRLQRWRGFLETVPKDDDPEGQIVRLIERDVLDHFESVLPIDGNDIMGALGLESGPKVGEALSDARRIHRLGITDRGELLDHLKRSHCLINDSLYDELGSVCHE